MKDNLVTEQLKVRPERERNSEVICGFAGKVSFAAFLGIVASLRSNAAPGPDHITAAMLKNLPIQVLFFIHLPCMLQLQGFHIELQIFAHARHTHGSSGHGSDIVALANSRQPPA